ncbi:MAG: hypothetical protein QME45_00175 [Clostridiales bacterium]|nr:hypothetical protein [Clostridiales bacterium]
MIAAEGIKSFVIDTERDFVRLELVHRIANAMNAEYFKLENL